MYKNNAHSIRGEASLAKGYLRRKTLREASTRGIPEIVDTVTSIQSESKRHS